MIQPYAVHTCLKETHFKFKDTNRLKEIHHANNNHERAEMAILRLEKLDLETKCYQRQRGIFYDDKKEKIQKCNKTISCFFLKDQ